jgi:hypothetical protein
MIIERIDQMVQKADLYYDTSRNFTTFTICFFDLVFLRITRELVLVKIHATTEQRRKFEDYLPNFHGCNVLTGYRSCYKTFFREFAERLICDRYYPWHERLRPDNKESPEWNLVEAVLPHVENYDDFYHEESLGALKIILNSDVKIKHTDPVLRFIGDGMLKAWEEFLATIIAANLLRLYKPHGALIIKKQEEEMLEYLKKWRSLVSDEVLKKKLSSEKATILSLESEELKYFLFGDNLEMNESF